MLVEKGARSLREALGAVREGASFLTRGVRLLGADLASSARIFSRALMGGTLRPREVQTLRRTARDVLSFVPFSAILIAPLSPVGHVLVFSFIQKYFPGFFPSQFTSRRQELYSKFEELTQRLRAAEEEATEETEAAGKHTRRTKAQAHARTMHVPFHASRALLCPGRADLRPSRHGAQR